MLRLKRFWTENYRRFGGRFGIDLSGTRDYRFSTGCVEGGTVVKGIVLGPNGSGKTGLGSALTDISYIVKGRRGQESRSGDLSAFGSVFHYEFSGDGPDIVYEYARTGRRTLSRESLSVEGGETVSRSGLSDASFLPDSGWKGRYPELDRAASLVGSFASGTAFIDMSVPSAYSRNDSLIADRGLTGEFREYMEAATGRSYAWIEEGSAMLGFGDLASAGEQELEMMFALSEVYGGDSFIFIDGLCDRMTYKAAHGTVERMISELACQVIGSTFNTGLVSNDILRPDCIFLMKEEGAIPLCDLTDKEIRYGHNLEKMLRNGEFGE